ncbi:GGDEF domain-containing phosphodiesterase [Oceaniglobus trochenteri]|uniref:GGDEF domain-containing phosphodiesterase n=1 Tax=Oceaniglobus trochenteri TaxID=2763260 RepID=UPI001CFFFD34|nr:GGDEF domain-containing phosphodiesterase [Oceaniglobus trochenteri]
MARLLQKFLIRSRRSGWSMPVLFLCLLGVVGASAAISGAEGVLFTSALGCAFLLGTASRPGPFHLRSLATQPLDLPVTRDVLLARMAASRVQDRGGDSLCIALAIDDFDRSTAQLGRGGRASLLRQMGERLYGQVRNGDTLADLGDGRFAVFLPPNPRIDTESAVQAALRLQAALARPFAIDGLRHHLTACAGFCTASRAGAPGKATALLDAALSALAMAQRQGPRSLRAHDGADAPLSPLRTAQGDDMARAFKAGRIVPWFQPQICADTGALTGVETLARWDHPDAGILLPAQFLAQVRDQGLSMTLTETMLDGALHHLRGWDRAGVTIPRISVNIGPEDLIDPRLADRVAWALDRHGLPPARLAIELQENALSHLDPDGMAARNLRALVRLGCPIELDDFGTGNASLTTLRRWSVDRIKIDRSLTAAVDTDPEQHAMVSAILTMAAQLGVGVLAEGVETPGQHSTLAQLGCDHVQGHAIARPMAPSDLLAWALRRDAAPAPRSAPPKPPHGATQPGSGGKTA